MLVLDIGLPDGSGLDLCRDLRHRPATRGLPVLMLSAHGEEIDRVLGLELGADDYVSKPFSPRELLARVRSLLRRSQGQASKLIADQAMKALANGPFDLDMTGQRIALNGQVLDLTRREFGLLADLLTHQGRIRARADLLQAVWGSDSDSTDRTVDTHIKTLRAKLQLADPEREHIVTHRGMGYTMAPHHG
ncbi:MAG: winged helix-turn-helix domain-containing protein [Polaromonas sp.]